MKLASPKMLSFLILKKFDFLVIQIAWRPSIYLVEGGAGVGIINIKVF